MLDVRTFIIFLSLMFLVIQNEGNEKVYDTYFNGFCYWSEDVTYHVHYSSGCKVYFTCQRGKFLDFHKCPESTVFNAETRECDPNAICKDRKRNNPTYDAWWDKIVNVIDDVLDVLNNSPAVDETSTSSTSRDTVAQTAIDTSTTVDKTPSSTNPDIINRTASTAVDDTAMSSISSGTITQIALDASITVDETAMSSISSGTITQIALDAPITVDETAMSSISSGTITQIALEASTTVDETATYSVSPGTITQIDASTTVLSMIDTPLSLFKSEAGPNPDLSQKATIYSVLENAKYFKSPIQNVKHQDIKPSAVPDTYELHTSVHLIPMQFDTQTSVLTYNLKSSAIPFEEGFPKTIGQPDLPFLDSILNTTRDTNILTDFILPLVQDILKNETIMAKVNHLFEVLFETADPLLYQILDRHVDEELGSTTTITLKELKEAWNKTSLAVRPIFKELVVLVHPVFFQRVAESGEIIMDYMDKNDAEIMHSIPSVFGSLFNMVFKYRLLDASNLDQFTTFSLNEIRRDFKELSNILFNVFGNKAP